MQEHLHIGRPSWKRLGRAVLIAILAVIFPFIVGLHVRLETTPMPASMGGNTELYYTGFGRDQYYEITPAQTNMITPLFVLIPFWESGKDIRGMRWVGHVSPYASHS